MSNIPENQISDWLKKLERESWQLELLVSAFTIFLLMIAIESFEGFMLDIQFQYDLSDNLLTFVFIFLFLLQKSLVALTICLVGHLMLRGFWIGTIGLRSVQSSIDFSKLNYNDFFTERLKKKVISLDQLVIKLDEICSVIFAFAFLVMSMLLAFGLYLLTFGILAIVLSTIGEITPDSWDNVIGIVAGIIFFSMMVSGLIYMIDYFTLGFFKKVKWLRKIYYPFYQFYNLITLAILSRSIYYYMISKFTKKRIRTVYGLVGAIIVIMILFDFDQHQYFPSAETDHLISTNYYDDLRGEDEYIRKASIESQYLDKPYFQLFVRYDPRDNSIVSEHCPDFVPVKDDGINWSLSVNADGGNFTINDQDHSSEDFDQLLSCLSSIYEVSVNDSVYQKLNYYYYEHPDKDQKGLLTVIPTDQFLDGENMLRIRKVRILENDSVKTGYQAFSRIPFWYKK
ncbi:MAG: hypothetical protein ABJG78_06675 [Cyclobacteriaceae bacterium]